MASPAVAAFHVQVAATDKLDSAVDALKEIAVQLQSQAGETHRTIAIMRVTLQVLIDFSSLAGFQKCRILFRGNGRLVLQSQWNREEDRAAMMAQKPLQALSSLPGITGEQEIAACSSSAFIDRSA